MFQTRQNILMKYGGQTVATVSVTVMMNLIWWRNGHSSGSENEMCSNSYVYKLKWRFKAPMI